MSERETNRVLTLNKLASTIADCRRQGKVIVTTNGCFDILHSGHLHLLNSAKALGDILVVGINSDRSVKKLKGNDRPLVSEKERAEILANLRAVDFVTIFEDDTANQLLSTIKPDIYVKGGDYSHNTLPEAQTVSSYGGTIRFIALSKGKSSSAVIQKIKKMI